MELITMQTLQRKLRLLIVNKMERLQTNISVKQNSL